MKDLWKFFFSLACGFLGAGLILLLSLPPRGEPVTLRPVPTPAELVVQVDGSVAHPGLYHLPHGSRVQHAVLAAGDFTAQADAGFINLAARLQDGQHIIVPAKPEPTRPFASPWPRQTTPTTAALRPTTAYTPAKGVTKGGAKVNINTANAAELESLPGIGPVLAEAILRYRSAYGPFKRIEDLLDVPGIGEKTLEKLKPFITI